RSVMRALAKVPADRFPTPAAFAEALANAPREAAVVSSPTPVARGRRRIAALAAAGLALVIVLAGYLRWPHSAVALDPNLAALVPFRGGGAPPGLGHPP